MDYLKSDKFNSIVKMCVGKKFYPNNLEYEVLNDEIARIKCYDFITLEKENIKNITSFKEYYIIDIPIALWNDFKETSKNNFNYLLTKYTSILWKDIRDNRPEAFTLYPYENISRKSWINMFGEDNWFEFIERL